jgi:TnpA family transposase
MDPSADYGCLNGIARHRINAKLIAEHWDDVLRLAGSLKLGVVQATSLMRTLQIGDRPTKLAQAVAELGRIDKTIHALTYIDDEAKRRRILNQLNKGEDRHKLARAVFHGKQGELRQRYREGQEDQLGALLEHINLLGRYAVGFIGNSLITWINRHFERILS